MTRYYHTTTSHNRASSMWWRVAFLIVASVSASPSLARSSDVPPLPPEAQAAIKKGMLAAKEQEWLIAIQSFQEARKTAPDAPEVFYNLGLAESKIPGRELRAIAWFGAYLAVNPHAPNAPAVTEFIAGLQIKNQGNVSRLITTVQDAAAQTVQNKDNNLASVAGLWAQSGDMGAAQRAVDLITDPFGKVTALIQIAKVQDDAGDGAGAQQTLSTAKRTADPTQDTSIKSRALYSIAEAQANAGDIVGAQNTATLIQEPFEKCQAQIVIAQAQTKAGDIAGANQTLAAAEKTSDLPGGSGLNNKIQIASAKIQTGDAAGARQTLVSARTVAKGYFDLGSIFYLQAQAGDIVGARQTLASAIQLSDLEKDAKQKDIDDMVIKRDYLGILHGLVDQRLNTGDIVGAQDIADLIKDADTKSYSQVDIARAQAKVGDIAGAQRTADLIRNAEHKGDAQRAIADAKAKSGSTSSPATTVGPTTIVPTPVQPVSAAIDVSSWINKLEAKTTYDAYTLNADPFLDLAGYLKSRPASDDPGKVFDALRTTAEKLIKAQNIIVQMLKQQAKQKATS